MNLPGDKVNDSCVFETNHELEDISENDLSNQILNDMSETSMQEDWGYESPDLEGALNLSWILIKTTVNLLSWSQECCCVEWISLNRC